MNKKSKRRIISRLIVAAFVLVSLLAVAFFLIGKELKQLELASNRRAVSSALNERISQLTKVADDNAFWDEAALSTYQKQDLPFLESAWGAPTSYGTVYEELAVIDTKWQMSLGFSKGKMSATSSVDLLSPDISAMVATSRSKGKAAGGVVRSASGLHFVSVAPILPTSGALISIVPKSGPSILLLTKTLTEEELAMIGEQVQLEGLALSQSQSGTDNALAITSPSGSSLGAISWRPTGLTAQMVSAALPLPLAMLILSLVLVAWMAIASERAIAQSQRDGGIDPLTGLDNLRRLEEQLADLRQDGLSLIVCRIEGDDQNLVRLATRQAYNLQTNHSRSLTFRAWLNNGAITFAWLGDVEPDLILSKTSGYSKLLADSFAELPGAAALSFGLGIACQTSADEPLLAIAHRGANAASTALSTDSGSVRIAATTDPETPDIKLSQSSKHNSPALDAIRFTPIVNPETRRITSFEPVLGETNARPWLNRDLPLETLTAVQRSLIVQALSFAVQWERINLTVRISANVACHPRFPQWLQSIAEDANFPLHRLEIIIVSNTVREGARARPTKSLLVQSGIATGMELWDASISALHAIAETPGAFVSVRVGTLAEREGEALVSAARAFAIPIQFSDVTTHNDHDLATRAGAMGVEGRFYLAPVEPDQVSRLLDSQNYPEKKPLLRLDPRPIMSVQTDRIREGLALTGDHPYPDQPLSLSDSSSALAR